MWCCVSVSLNSRHNKEVRLPRYENIYGLVVLSTALQWTHEVRGMRTEYLYCVCTWVCMQNLFKELTAER